MENKKYIDIAVLCQEFNELEQTCDKINNICLDEIYINKNDFSSSSKNAFLATSSALMYFGSPLGLSE